MMPDLANYAGTVLGAYAVTLGLLAALVALSWWRSEQVKRALRETETRVGGRRDGRA